VPESASKPPAPTAGRAALSFIFITVVLDMLALGMIIPVLPRLVKDFSGGDTARASVIYGVFGTAWALMQFVAAPVLGVLSDRWGRRPVVLISNFGLGLDYVLMALAPNLTWLFIGRIISGITAASVPAATAYIADVTPAEKRAGAFGMLGAAFGMGFVIGPAAGGLLGNISPRLPFWVAAGLSLVNALYGLFVLPESLGKEHRCAFSWKRANPLGSLKLLNSHPELFGLASANFLSFLAHEVLPSTFVLYATYRYAWNQRDVGLCLGAVGICFGLVQGALVRPIVGRLGERKALWLGLTFGVAGFAAYGLAPTGSWFLMAVPIMALWGLAGPAAQGLMSQRVGVSEQGQLQGANGSLRGISGLIGPLLFTGIFSAFISPHSNGTMPGAPFLLASLFLVFALLIAWRVTKEHA
jgi:DHA1 family tetracycline resistance protein-like MFS transporter